MAQRPTALGCSSSISAALPHPFDHSPKLGLCCSTQALTKTDPSTHAGLERTLLNPFISCRVYVVPKLIENFYRWVCKKKPISPRLSRAGGGREKCVNFQVLRYFSWLGIIDIYSLSINKWTRKVLPTSGDSVGPKNILYKELSGVYVLWGWMVSWTNVTRRLVDRTLSPNTGGTHVLTATT